MFQKDEVVMWPVHGHVFYVVHSNENNTIVSSKHWLKGLTMSFRTKELESLNRVAKRPWWRKIGFFGLICPVAY